MTDASPYEKLVDLIRKLSHDVRAPLGSIMSTSDMLSQGSYDALTPKQARANDRIQRNSQRVLAILDDFATYIKADAGQLDAYPKPFDPRTSLSEWVSHVTPAAEKKGLTLYVTTHERVPLTLIGDIAIISRALLPLVWNAVIFTSEGDVWIDSDWSHEDRWIITVKDSGPGISPENAPYIFEPFWRGEERPQTITAGVGLGLALSLALAKHMTGTLRLEKTNAQGSSFSLEIPLSSAPC